MEAQQQIETNYLETNLEEEVEAQQQIETNYLHRDLPHVNTQDTHYHGIESLEVFRLYIKQTGAFDKYPINTQSPLLTCSVSLCAASVL